MNTKITAQTGLPANQSPAGAVPRNKAAGRTPDAGNAAGTAGKGAPGSSYTLDLSETAQAMIASRQPSVSSAEEARKQLDAIRSAARQSAGTVLDTQKPRPQSVIDLLA